MSKVTIVIPNYNGIEFMDECLTRLTNQDYTDFCVIVVDNGSKDGSVETTVTYKERLDLSTICFEKNTGFSVAVNAGIKASKSEYVILLNNDAYVRENFVSELVKKMDSDERIFSAQALMLQNGNPDKVDSAGDYFSAMGWGFSRGKDKDVSYYTEDFEIFSSCAGAAIYRKNVLDEIGCFDEEFFAYLEDMDLGYRARLKGYINVLASKAIVYHVGSASTGSRHNSFKVKISSRNSFLVMYKNFAAWQWIVNMPLIGFGCLVKLIFFGRKKMAKDYTLGIREYSKYKNKVTKTVPVKGIRAKLQLKLIKNCFLRILK